eukprot:scaffold40912_cov63-Phaeocystis_antarctica.AAC.3
MAPNALGGSCQRRGRSCCLCWAEHKCSQPGWALCSSGSSCTESSSPTSRPLEPFRLACRAQCHAGYAVSARAMSNRYAVS